MKLPSAASARNVALAPADVLDVATVARALPDPDGLPPGTLVIISGTVAAPPSLANRVLAALGRKKEVTRALRATAMVARGYVDVAAGVGGDDRGDLVWGYSSRAERAPDAVTDTLTERDSGS